MLDEATPAYMGQNIVVVIADVQNDGKSRRVKTTTALKTVCQFHIAKPLCQQLFTN